MNENEKTTQQIDPIISILLDLEMRITSTRDTLTICENLVNEIREISKTRQLKTEDVDQLNSLLFVVDEFFDVVPGDLATSLLRAITEKNTTENNIKV